MTFSLSPASSALPAPQLDALQALVLAMPMARTLGLRFVSVQPGQVEMVTLCMREIKRTNGHNRSTYMMAAAIKGVGL